MVATGKMETGEAHKRFTDSGRTHVLMITNHGVHEWKVVPGMPDTGGQNVYVNQFTEALVAQGYRVTIANRGGYAHPGTGEMQAGIVYHPSGFARIMYVEDGTQDFVRKEDMHEQLSELAGDLKSRLKDDGDAYDLVISHYWDAGVLGVMVNGTNGQRVPHVWVPHSLGALKKRNMDPSTWEGLRIDERIEQERKMLESLDGGVATSSAIRDTFRDDYQFDARYFLPPCVDEDRYRPRSADELGPIWSYLSEQTGQSIESLQKRKFVTEISRTDKTKRKDVVVKAFAQVKKEVPEAMLLLSCDSHAKELYNSIEALVEAEGLKDDVVLLGSIWDILPLLYAVTDVYCTPSVMEGFGMSAQEAAATAKPVVASNLVPFVVEYLVGSNPDKVAVEGDGGPKELLFGDGGIIVPADFVAGFAEGITRLLKDDDLRKKMGDRARDITIPYFTWAHLTEALLSDLGVSSNGKA